MVGSYNLRVRQSGEQVSVLPFPESLAERIRTIFQSQYPTGQEFINALDGNRQPMLDAMASCYPSPQKSYVASIEGDKLVLKFVVSPESGGSGFHLQLSQNEYSALAVMAYLLGNYLHAKSSIDLSKPVALEGTIDENIDPMGIKNGQPPLEELTSIFSGMRDADETTKYITINTIIVDKN